LEVVSLGGGVTKGVYIVTFWCFFAASFLWCVAVNSG